MFAILTAKLITPFFGVDAACSHSFFFFPSWWQYLPDKDQPTAANGCSVSLNTFPGDIWAIGLSVLDMLLRVGGLVAIISIIIAGVSYITASGNAETAAKARKRIYNSLIGLAIVFVATAVVTFVGDSIK